MINDFLKELKYKEVTAAELYEQQVRAELPETQWVKKCTRCDKWKNTKEFAKTRHKWLLSQCKDCNYFADNERQYGKKMKEQPSKYWRCQCSRICTMRFAFCPRCDQMREGITFNLDVLNETK